MVGNQITDEGKVFFMEEIHMEVMIESETSFTTLMK